MVCSSAFLYLCNELEKARSSTSLCLLKLGLDELWKFELISTSNYNPEDRNTLKVSKV